MKIKRILPVIIAVMLLAGAVLFTANQEKPASETSRKTTGAKKSVVKKPQEMRGVWVAYMALDVENATDKQAALTAETDRIIKDMQEGGFNTMIVQVRPFCDAIYPSEYFPWSHIISGTQGVAPDFDPLELIVEKCRENGLSVHAWVNPYRVATEQTPAELSSNNPVVQDENLGVTINGCRYLDPASEKARQLIADGVRELAGNYDIDGVQFDDYFYPEDCGDFDSAAYEAYLSESGEQITLEEFRRQNVSEMVRMAYEAVHSTGKELVFGISPQGNLGNNDGLFADVRTWCSEEGYIDYICPQIYFSLDNPALGFEDCLNEWLRQKRHDGLQLIVGLAGYKAGTDADSGTWLDNDDILMTEITILRKQKTNGFILYSSDSFRNEDNQREIENVKAYLTNSARQKSS